MFASEARCFLPQNSPRYGNYGFVINHYEPCVTNRIINGIQMAVVWYVNDIKIFLKDLKEVTKLIN